MYGWERDSLEQVAFAFQRVETRYCDAGLYYLIGSSSTGTSGCLLDKLGSSRLSTRDILQHIRLLGPYHRRYLGPSGRL